MIGPERIRRLVPHAGSMCLLEQVLDWDAGSIRCVAHNHSSPQHPLRHSGGLAGVHLVEYCAQALALHRGLIAEAAGEPAHQGWLVAVRGFRLRVVRLDELGGPLLISARQLMHFDGSVQYETTAEAGGREIGGGRIAVARAPL